MLAEPYAGFLCSKSALQMLLQLCGAGLGTADCCVGVQQMRLGAWEGWLEEAAQSSDCKLSSHATRALLHLHSARALAAAQRQVVHLLDQS